MAEQNIFIVIPAYNEEKLIGNIIEGLKQKGYENIIVVDDGSSDRTSEIASGLNAVVCRHMVNRGLGGALGTGIRAALERNADIIVTFDADGQHSPDDLENLVKPITEGKAEVVIGSRLINSDGMPFIRKIGNLGLNIVTFLLFGIWVTDSQSGLRAFSRKAAERIQIRTNRMEVSSEIVHEIARNHFKLREVPIKAIYTDYSMQHGQSNLNAISIVFKLLLKKLMR